MAEIACFLSLLMELKSHNTCIQGNKYMEIYRTILCIKEEEEEVFYYDTENDDEIFTII